MSEEKSTQMRTEKCRLMSKRNALKEIASYLDPLLKLKDTIGEIATDGDMDPEFLLRWSMDQMHLFEYGDLDNNDDEDSEEEESEEGGE